MPSFADSFLLFLLLLFLIELFTFHLFQTYRLINLLHPAVRATTGDQKRVTSEDERTSMTSFNVTNRSLKKGGVEKENDSIMSAT